MTAIVSIGVEGWGEPVSGLPYRLRRSHAHTCGGTVSPALILADHPATLSERAQVARGWSTRGQLDFSVVHLDADEAGQDLRRWLWQANPEYVGQILTALTASTTSISAKLRGGEAWGGTPFDLYLEREVLRVTAVTGPVGGVYTLTVQRGRYGSTAAAHSVDVESDVYLYQRNPIVVGRRVTRYELDPDAGTETAVWTGLLGQPPGMAQGMVALGLTAQSAIGYFAEDADFGKGRIEFSGWIWDTTNGGAAPSSAGTVPVPAESGGVPLSGGPYARVDDVEHVVFADGEHVAAAAIYRGASGEVHLSPPTAPVPLFGTDKGATLEDAPETIVECLIADEESPYSLVRNGLGALSSHPLDVLLCTMTSTGGATWPSGGAHTVGPNGPYDWLPAHFGWGVPSDLIDIAGIEALRDESLYVSGLSVRNFVLWETARAPDLVGRLLQPGGLFPATSAEGKITIVAIRDYADADADATLTDDDLARRVDSQPWAALQRYGKVRMDLARKGLSSAYGLQITDTQFSDYLSNRFPFGVSELVVDGGDYGNPETHQVPRWVRSPLFWLNRMRWTLLVQRLPVYRVSALPGAPRLAVGSKVLLTNRVVVSDEGNRGTTRRRCIVLEHAEDPATGAQDLLVVDLYPVTRASQVVAPTWRVDSVASAAVFSVSAAEFTSDDWAQWLDGVDVMLYDRTGAPRATVPRSGTIAAGTVTLSTGWDVAPSVGDIVRIPDYDAAPADWSTRAWIADDNATLGAAGDDPARWSF